MSNKNTGKIVKVLEHSKQKMPNTEKRLDIWEDKYMADLHKSGQKLPPVYQLPSDNFVHKMINQAVYYVANNDIKSARKILISMGVPSWDAKCFCKEEARVQARNPEERARYYNKPMPKEFKTIEYMQ